LLFYGIVAGAASALAAALAAALQVTKVKDIFLYSSPLQRRRQEPAASILVPPFLLVLVLVLVVAILFLFRDTRVDALPFDPFAPVLALFVVCFWCCCE